MRFLIVVALLLIYVNGAESEMGGQIVLDTARIKGDDYSANGREVRRARLFIKGDMSKRLKYEIEYSLTGSKEWKDVYIKHKTMDNLGIQIGNIKEPMGLETLTSSKYNSFMERSLTDTFMHDRKLGILVHGTYKDEEHRGTISFGIFGKSLDKLFAKKRDGTSIIGRITYALVHAKDDVVHLGLSTGRTKYRDQSLKFSTDAGTHLYKGSLIKTKLKNIEKSKRVALEAAMVKGAFSFQGEYIAITASNKQDDFNGWYGQVSLFMTGEHRNYKTKSAKFSRIKIREPFKQGVDGYWGALELALRVSQINLNSNKNKRGKKEHDITVGVNWHVKKNFRMMSNYTVAKVTEPNIEKEEIIQLRGQYDF